MVPAGNKAKHLLSVNHTPKTIHHHNHHHHHHNHHAKVVLITKKEQFAEVFVCFEF